MMKKSKKKDEEDDIKPDGYIGDISQAEYWEWRCACAEKMLAKERHERNVLTHRLMCSEMENKKLSIKVFNLANLTNSKQAVELADNDLQDTRKKLSDTVGQPIDGCIINEAFQVLKPDDSHGSAELAN